MPPPSPGSVSTTAQMVQSAREETYVIPTTTGYPLPRGVPDLHTWARELPKLKERRWSYGRLAREAYNDIELLSYVKWLMVNYKEAAQKPEPKKASDYAAFLLAIDYPAVARYAELSSSVRTLVNE